MANIKDLIVNGESRFVGDIYENDGIYTSCEDIVITSTNGSTATTTKSSVLAQYQKPYSKFIKFSSVYSSTNTFQGIKIKLPTPLTQVVSYHLELGFLGGAEAKIDIVTTDLSMYGGSGVSVAGTGEYFGDVGFMNYPAFRYDNNYIYIICNVIPMNIIEIPIKSFIQDCGISDGFKRKPIYIDAECSYFGLTTAAFNNTKHIYMKNIVGSIGCAVPMSAGETVSYAYGHTSGCYYPGILQSVYTTDTSIKRTPQNFINAIMSITYDGSTETIYNYTGQFFRKSDNRYTITAQAHLNTESTTSPVVYVTYNSPALSKQSTIEVVGTFLYSETGAR